MSGHIVLYCGPMFAGKTTRLLEAVRWHDDAVVYKPAVDDRYGKDKVSTHTGAATEARVVGSAAEIEAGPVVAIDEAQFFDDGLVARVRELRSAGSHVFLAGLDTDFRGEGFEPMPQIKQLADHIEHLMARCDVCGGEAVRTQRLIDGEPAPADAPTVDVGGDERYEARCPDCHTVR